jgi:hypothetical protein
MRVDRTAAPRRFGLAYETTKLNYAAYWSAEEGRRVAV